MFDKELELHVCRVTGFDHFRLTNANDLRELRLWVWEKHRLRFTISYGEECLSIAVMKTGLFPSAYRTFQHDGTRASIIRAEGLAMVITFLNMIQEFSTNGPTTR
jgi:hypothetical protein